MPLGKNYIFGDFFSLAKILFWCNCLGQNDTTNYLQKLWSTVRFVAIWQKAQRFYGEFALVKWNEFILRFYKPPFLGHNSLHELQAWGIEKSALLFWMKWLTSVTRSSCSNEFCCYCLWLKKQFPISYMRNFITDK